MSRKMLITAGPTHEPIDDVRYLANRSSGKLGMAIAEAAHSSGWDVTLLLGPVAAAPPAGVRTIRFESTADLESILAEHFPNCDVLVMAAAVADYRPESTGRGKLERSSGGLTLRLSATPDLVAGCARTRKPGQRIIGFALEEPEKLAARAAEKLRRKGLDALVANPLATMGDDRIAAELFLPDGQRIKPEGRRVSPDAPGPIDKIEFARWLVNWIDANLGS